MSETAKLGLPLIAAAQAQKHVTHNEALAMLDTLVQLSVLDKDLSSPPGEPEEGDSYIVASGASGSWSGWEDRIARFQDGAWVSLIPQTGWLAWVIDEEELYHHDGASWELAAPGDVIGPASCTDNNLPQWDGTSGNLLKDGRAIGVGASTAIPDRAAADGRYARIPASPVDGNFPVWDGTNGLLGEGQPIESGTWTPIFAFNNPGDLSVSYSSQVGLFARIGGMVYVTARITFTPTWTNSSGTAQIENLPFVPAGSSRSSASINFMRGPWSYPGDRTWVVAATDAGFIRLRAMGEGVNDTTFSTGQLTSGEEHRLEVGMIYGVA